MAYKNQHIIPRTYLKHFSIENFVHFVDLKNRYATQIKREGISHKRFCKTEYYDFPNSEKEPVLEKMFGKFESNYSIIISSLGDKTDLGYETKQLIIDWILMMKKRNTLFRDNFSELFGWVERTSFGLIHGREAMKQKENKFKENGEKSSKAFQLSNFLDKKRYDELREAYSTNFLNRHWIVLQSSSDNFLTSDNPGFSISFSPHINKLALSPLSSRFNLDNNLNSIHYFPLTSNMCLCLFPILEGDLSKLTEEEMKKLILSDISFEYILPEDILKINNCTIDTAYELIIGKEKSDLEKHFIVK